MDIEHSPIAAGGQPVVVTRVADDEWHALRGDQPVGSGHAFRRPDGRTFISVDAWHGPVFDRLAQAMPADLPAPLHTVVDEHDGELIAAWQRHGFTVGRREFEYLVPTDPQVTGLGAAQPPSGVTILPMGGADEALLRVLDGEIRAEVGAAVGWHSMPAEVVSLPPGVTVVDPSTYAVAVEAGRYVGLLRLARHGRRSRIGLLAVRTDRRRSGIARALLAEVLGALHRAGTGAVSAEVVEANGPAVALFEGIGARRAGGNLELVRR